MPNSLSIRDQNSFISAYKNLLNDNDKRIHKNDVNTLNKILNNCNKIEVGQMLMTKMETYPKDPAALENTFSKLFFKLEAQNSKLYDKKEEKLKNIQQKLAPIVHDIHKNEINGEIKGLTNDLKLICIDISQKKKEIANFQENIAKADVQIKKLHDEIKPLHDVLKNTSPEAFAAKDAQRLKETKAKISQLETRKNADIKALNKIIVAHENSRATLLDFARSHGVKSAEQSLIKAESGAIYDNRDTGFGTTSWREYMGSDEYAIKHFGHDLEGGRRQYSASIKVPNHKGKEWQKLMQNFNNAPKKIKALQKEISQINKKCKSDIDQVNSESRLSFKQEIEQRIDSKQQTIRSLENDKEFTSSQIKLNHDYISALEAMKSPLTAKMEELNSHIKQKS